jgi:hypothetical protein
MDPTPSKSLDFFQALNIILPLEAPITHPRSGVLYQEDYAGPNATPGGSLWPRHVPILKS